MRTILFIHGFPLDATMWNHQRNAGFPMLAPDLPGFGGSTSPPPEPPTIEAYADYVWEVIGQQKEKPIVAGLSMGGYVLLALLRKHAAGVAGAILIDTRADPDSPEARANRLKAIDDVRANGTGNVINGLMGRLLAPGATEAVKHETREIMERQSAAAVVAAQTAMANRRDQTELLPQLKLPTLIIVGEKDAITPPPLARAMHAAIPGSRLAEIPGVGHMSPMEAPEAVNAVLRDFAAGG
jgi:pimeloyl-ACP methyl ester carboxylesterase